MLSFITLLFLSISLFLLLSPSLMTPPLSYDSSSFHHSFYHFSITFCLFITSSSVSSTPKYPGLLDMGEHMTFIDAELRPCINLSSCHSFKSFWGFSEYFNGTHGSKSLKKCTGFGKPALKYTTFTIYIAPSMGKQKKL